MARTSAARASGAEARVDVAIGDRPDLGHVERQDVLPRMLNWRYVVGTFQVKIPVTTSEVMLRPDENTYAIMTWRLGRLATTNRWHPVLTRYVDVLGARITGLGGDPGAIEPSPDGLPLPTTGGGHGGHGEGHAHRGRVCDVAFDCHGDFEGFTLSACCSGRHHFHACEPGVRELVLRACHDRLTLEVIEGDEPGSVHRIHVHG